MLACILGACTLGCDSAVRSQTDTGPSRADPFPDVVLIGSSSAAGAGASRFDRSYAGRLASWIRTRNPRSGMVDLAVGGYTTFELRPVRSSPTPSRPVVDTARNIDAALAMHPRLVLIHLPSNDVARGYGLMESLRNLEAMIDLARASKTAVAVIGPHPRGYPGARRDSLKLWARRLDLLAGTETIRVWDSLSFDSATLRPGVNRDGTHFNDSGHAIVFRQILRSRSWRATFPDTTPNP